MEGFYAPYSQPLIAFDMYVKVHVGVSMITGQITEVTCSLSSL